MMQRSSRHPPERGRSETLSPSRMGTILTAQGSQDDKQMGALLWSNSMQLALYSTI